MATAVELPEGFTLDEAPDINVETSPVAVVKPDATTLPPGFNLDSPEVAEPTNAYIRNREIIKSSLEGLLTGSGAIFGGIAGGTLGSIVPFAGTGAGVATGGGTGGTLGFAASQEIIDLLDNFFGVSQPEGLISEAKELGEELKTGAEISFGGEIIGPVVGPIMKQIARPLKFIKNKLPPLGMSSLKKKAGKILADIGTEGTEAQIKQNMRTGKALEEKIPGLKFTRGQLTNDAQAIALERALVRKGGADLQQEQRTFANKALQDYYNKKLSGVGKISDFTEAIVAKQEGLESTIRTSQNRVDSEVNRLSRVMDEQDIGGDLVKKLSIAKKTARESASAKFDLIPNTNLNPSPLNESITDLIGDFDKAIEPAENFPRKIVEGVLKKINPSGQALKNIGFKDLRKLRSTIGAEMNKASSGINPNLPLARRLGIIKDGIEDTILQLETKPGNIGSKFRDANSTFREYVGKFRQGTVADVLQKGSRGEETKIALANIGSKFFTKDGIDDFMRAVGDDTQAVDIMRDYARFDILNKAQNPLTGEVTQKGLSKWLKTNSKVLEKLGINQEFQDVRALQAGLDIAKKNLNQFNKSVASNILEADVDNLVTVAYSSSKNVSSRTRELLDLAKGDENAKAGLRKAVADHILEKSKTTGLDLFGEPVISVANLTKQIKRFEPAMQILYKGQPDKIQAIKDVHQSFRILNRNLKSPLGGGSDTAENIANATVSVVTPLVVSRFAVVNAVKSLTRTFTQFSEESLNNYLLRASFDSDFAQGLINLAKNPESQKAISRFGELMILPNLAAEKADMGVSDFMQSIIPQTTQEQGP